jgi:hypothetical protein
MLAVNGINLINQLANISYNGEENGVSARLKMAKINVAGNSA